MSWSLLEWKTGDWFVYGAFLIALVLLCIAVRAGIFGTAVWIYEAVRALIAGECEETDPCNDENTRNITYAGVNRRRGKHEAIEDDLA